MRNGMRTSNALNRTERQPHMKRRMWCYVTCVVLDAAVVLAELRGACSSVELARCSCGRLATPTKPPSQSVRHRCRAAPQTRSIRPPSECRDTHSTPRLLRTRDHSQRTLAGTPATHLLLCIDTSAQHTTNLSADLHLQTSGSLSLAVEHRTAPAFSAVWVILKRWLVDPARWDCSAQLSISADVRFPGNDLAESFILSLK